MPEQRIARRPGKPTLGNKKRGPAIALGHLGRQILDRSVLDGARQAVELASRL